MFGEGDTFDINGSSVALEKMLSINFAKIKFCLNVNENGDKSRFCTENEPLSLKLIMRASTLNSPNIP